MKKLIVILLFGIIGCKGKQQPKDLPLGPEQFEQVLMDIHRLESNYTSEFFRIDSLSPTLNKQYDSLFKANGIQREQFYQTFTAYSLQFPEDLDTIYQHILDEFEHERDSLRAQQRKIIPKKDSIQPINKQLELRQLNEKQKQ